MGSSLIREVARKQLASTMLALVSAMTTSVTSLVPGAAPVCRAAVEVPRVDGPHCLAREHTMSRRATLLGASASVAVGSVLLPAPLPVHADSIEEIAARSNQKARE